jgi:hypothetical protein
MKKSKNKLDKNLSFTIDMNELNLNRRKFTTSEIGRGIGIEKSKKGKGSYTRKNVKYDNSSCGYSFLFKLENFTNLS